MTVPPRQLAALCAVADALAGAGVRWLLAGSAGRALLGVPVRPRDIDIEVAPDDGDVAAATLGAELADASGGGRRSRRAQVERAGIEVDISSGFAIDGPTGRLDADFERQWQWSHATAICDRTVRIAPLEESLCRAIVATDWARVAEVAGQAARSAPPVRLDVTYVAARLSSARASATR
jgi:hypothetical protein